MEKRSLGTITILASDRQGSSAAINQLISDFGHYIMARLGVNVNRQCFESCPGMITISLDAPRDVFEKLAEKFNAIPNVKAEVCIMIEE